MTWLLLFSTDVDDMVIVVFSVGIGGARLAESFSVKWQEGPCSCHLCGNTSLKHSVREMWTNECDVFYFSFLWKLIQLRQTCLVCTLLYILNT